MEKCTQRRPRQRLDDKEVGRIATTTLLEREASLKNSSGTMRSAYVPVNRPDISETVKTLAKEQG